MTLVAWTPPGTGVGYNANMKKAAAKDRKRLRPAAVLALSMALLLPGVGEASRTLPPAFGAKVVPEITAAELLNFSRSDAPAARRFTLIDAENCLSFAALSVVGSADTACFSAPSHFKLFDLPSPIDRLSSLDLDQKTAYRRFFEPTERIYRQKITLSGISHQGGYFLQPDPLGPVDSPNLYQGFGFDALNVTDPYGECWLTGDDVPCSDYAKEIGRTFFSSSPKASIAGAKATGRFLKHEAIGTGKFVISVAKLGRQVVRHPILSAQAAGHAAVNVSEGFRALVDTVTMDPVEALKEAGSGFANADPNAVAEGLGAFLTSVFAFEAGGRAVSELRGTLAEGLEAPGGGAAAADDFVTFYHGTSKGNAARIRAGGIDLTESRPNLDFGPGFYTTDDLIQAQKWAARAGDGGEVLAFRGSRSELANVRALDMGTQTRSSFGRFFGHNRFGGRMHSYDVVAGPMLGRPSQFLRGGPLQVWGQQTSFHTQRAVDLLFAGLLP